MLSFICAYDPNSQKAISEIAQLLCDAKSSFYLTATQSIKKLRLESDILSSFLSEKKNKDLVSMLSITEFMQEISRKAYARADCRFILCKIVESQKMKFHLIVLGKIRYQYQNGLCKLIMENLWNLIHHKFSVRFYTH